MRRVVLFASIFILLLLSIVSAEKVVEIIPSSSSVSLTTGEVSSVRITIRNNQMFDDVFSISVFPSFISGVSASLERTMISIPANSEKTINLYFSAPLDTDQFVSVFVVTVKSLADPSVQDTTNILLQTFRKTPVYISDIKLDKYAFDPGETILLDIMISNADTSPSASYRLKTIITKGNLTIQKFDDIIEKVDPRSTISVKNSYTLGEYAEPGNYLVSAKLEDALGKVVSSKDIRFRVNAVYKLPAGYTEKKTKVGFLSIETTIVVKNEGNVASPPFYISESIPAIAKELFSPVIQPTYVNRTDHRIVYTWLIPSLLPGQSVIITYRISLLTVWIVSLIIIFAVWTAYRYTFIPRIIKTHRFYGPITRGKEIPIILEVKNKKPDEIKNVTVEDLVPPIFKVLKDFPTVKPRIKKTADGVKLTWKFASLKPKEERVFSYKIKPLVDIVGSIKLPKARMRYTDMKKRKKEKLSSELEIKP